MRISSSRKTLIRAVQADNETILEFDSVHAGTEKELMNVINDFISKTLLDVKMQCRCHSLSPLRKLGRHGTFRQNIRLPCRFHLHSFTTNKSSAELKFYVYNIQCCMSEYDNFSDGGGEVKLCWK